MQVAKRVDLKVPLSQGEKFVTMCGDGCQLDFDLNTLQYHVVHLKLWCYMSSIAKWGFLKKSDSMSWKHDEKDFVLKI